MLVEAAAHASYYADNHVARVLRLGRWSCPIGRTGYGSSLRFTRSISYHECLAAVRDFSLRTHHARISVRRTEALNITVSFISISHIISDVSSHRSRDIVSAMISHYFCHKLHYFSFKWDIILFYRGNTIVLEIDMMFISCWYYCICSSLYIHVM